MLKINSNFKLVMMIVKNEVAELLNLNTKVLNYKYFKIKL